MLVLLLWNWSSHSGMLPSTETHLKQPIPAAEQRRCYKIYPLPKIWIFSFVANRREWSEPDNAMCRKIAFYHVGFAMILIQRKDDVNRILAPVSWTWILFPGSWLLAKTNPPHLNWEAERPGRPLAGRSPSSGIDLALYIENPSNIRSLGLTLEILIHH